MGHPAHTAGNRVLGTRRGRGMGTPSPAGHRARVTAWTALFLPGKLWVAPGVPGVWPSCPKPPSSNDHLWMTPVGTDPRPRPTGIESGSPSEPEDQAWTHPSVAAMVVAVARAPCSLCLTHYEGRAMEMAWSLSLFRVSPPPASLVSCLRVRSQNMARWTQAERGRWGSGWWGPVDMGSGGARAHLLGTGGAWTEEGAPWKVRPSPPWGHSLLCPLHCGGRPLPHCHLPGTQQPQRPQRPKSGHGSPPSGSL